MEHLPVDGENLHDYWQFIDVNDDLKYISLERKESRKYKMAVIDEMRVLLPSFDDLAWLLQVEQDPLVKKALKKLKIDFNKLRRYAEEAEETSSTILEFTSLESSGKSPESNS